MLGLIEVVWLNLIFKLQEQACKLQWEEKGDSSENSVKLAFSMLPLGLH